MPPLARLLVKLGILLIIAGGAVYLLARLPGDISWQHKNVSVYFPLGTSILISVILSIILYLLTRFRR